MRPKKPVLSDDVKERLAFTFATAVALIGATVGIARIVIYLATGT